MDDLRLFTIFEALSQGVSVDHIHDITKIDKWFICKLQNLVAFEASLQGGSPSRSISRRRNTATLTRPWPAWRGGPSSPAPPLPQL
ncbi:MAG: hypothetical protein ACLR53_07565 [Evtepia gabavorous]